MTQSIEDERIFNQKQSPEPFEFNPVKKQLMILLSGALDFSAEDSSVSWIELRIDFMARAQNGELDQLILDILWQETVQFALVRLI